MPVCVYVYGGEYASAPPKGVCERMSETECVPLKGMCGTTTS